MEEPGEQQASVATVAVLLQVLVLATVLAVGHLLSRLRVTWIGEAGVALALGAAVSVLTLLAPGLRTLVAFNQEFFFLALLPPIIFQAGYSLNTESFFRNCGAISAFAFAGTFVSTWVVGGVVWAGGAAGLYTQLTLPEALLYGAIVSATDPVTVLAVFEKLHADEDLYALVFGESVLNDAVAIVLYRVLAGFLHERVTAGAITKGLGAFLLIFLGSMAIGAAIGFTVSYIIKLRAFRSAHAPVETCVAVLLAYSAYLVADALSLSGIVAVLFCGMVMSHYARPNMSRVGAQRTGAFFKVYATLAETFVFSYIGASLLIQQQGWEQGRITSFVVVALVALAVSRAANVFPISALVNYLRPSDLRIPGSQQFVMWWAGLRGAMAFALALEAAGDLPGGRGELLLTAVYFIIVLTVLANGGACAFLLSTLGLQAEAAERLPSPSKYERLELAEEEEDGGDTIPAGAITPPHELMFGSAVCPPLTSPGTDSAGRPPSVRRLDRLREANRRGLLSKLNRLDERWLGRIFLAGEHGLELPEVVPAGDVDAEEQPEHGQRGTRQG